MKKNAWTLGLKFKINLKKSEKILEKIGKNISSLLPKVEKLQWISS